MMSNILGYARVSTDKQELESQKDRLNEVGAIRIFEDIISGKIFKHPGFDALIAYAWPNDLLCVVKLLNLPILMNCEKYYVCSDY